jgi:hypothetical protein
MRSTQQERIFILYIGFKIFDAKQSFHPVASRFVVILPSALLCHELHKKAVGGSSFRLLRQLLNSFALHFRLFAKTRLFFGR